MATIDDLNIKSILNMDHDEAIEHLRQVRLSRRIPVKKTKSKSASKAKSKAKPKLSQTQAANLLKDLEDLVK